MNILVVDDEAVVLESCRKILNSEGFEVTLVPGVDDALATLEEQRGALLLIDIKMPERGGLYLMEVLRERGEKIPMVVRSGELWEPDFREAPAGGWAR